MAEQKESRKVLSKWGNDLRQTYRTMGQAAGLSEVDMHLLMNHSLPGVNAGYITRAKLLSGHLRATQEKLSKTMMDASGVEGRIWPFLAARKLGDPVRDPTLPDPRSNRAREERFWAIDAPRLLKVAATRPAPIPTPAIEPTTAAWHQPPSPPRVAMAKPTPAPTEAPRRQPETAAAGRHDPVRSLLNI